MGPLLWHSSALTWISFPQCPLAWLLQLRNESACRSSQHWRSALFILGVQGKFIDYQVQAMKILCRNEEVSKGISSSVLKFTFLRRRIGKAFCTGRLSEQQAKPSWLFFFLLLWHLSICDFLWFASHSARASAALAWFNCIQYFLLPFGCHLAHRSGLSKRDTAMRKDDCLLKKFCAPLSKSVLSSCHPVTAASFPWLGV